MKSLVSAIAIAAVLSLGVPSATFAQDKPALTEEGLAALDPAQRTLLEDQCRALEGGDDSANATGQTGNNASDTTDDSENASATFEANEANCAMLDAGASSSTTMTTQEAPAAAVESVPATEEGLAALDPAQRTLLEDQCRALEGGDDSANATGQTGNNASDTTDDSENASATFEANAETCAMLGAM